MAHDKGMPVHVWVDETRPRNQGASLTAWELGQHGVPHTVIADNAGGHLMQHGAGRPRDRRHRPRHRAGRRVQQDRHLPQGARRARQRRAVLRGAAVADDRLHGADGVAKSRSSSAAREEVTTMTGVTADGRIESVRIVPDGSHGRELRLRRDAGAARDRADHRARRAAGDAREALAAAFPERAAAARADAAAE